MQEIPVGADCILATLDYHGYSAYLVGGCVRDMLMGRTPNDWDITTSALPEEVSALFPKVIPTGLQHGTVTVMEDGIGYEVTTMRKDGNYSDGRRPDEVIFTKSLREDVMRRDFTMGAIAMDVHGNIIDHFGGCQDIRDRIIRCVGDPKTRFMEDDLRMLRAARFAAMLGFDIHPDTLEAMTL